MSSFWMIAVGFVTYLYPLATPLPNGTPVMTSNQKAVNPTVYSASLQRARSCLPRPYQTPHKARSPQTFKMDAQDRAMFRLLRRAHYTSRHCQQQIWKGQYPLHQMPTYLINIGSSRAEQPAGIRGFLINHPNPPKGAVLIPPHQVFGLQKVYLYQKQINDLKDPGFQFSLSINGVSTFAIGYGTQPGIRPRPKEFLELLIHEGFHRHQLHKGKWQHQHSTISTEKYPLNAQQVAYSLLENRVLRKGLAGTDAKRTLQTLYAIRRLRIAQAGRKKRFILRHDNEQERIEGTATYIENKMMKLIGYPIKHHQLNGLAGRLHLVGYYIKRRDTTFMREGLLAEALTLTGQRNDGEGLPQKRKVMRSSFK